MRISLRSRDADLLGGRDQILDPIRLDWMIAEFAGIDHPPVVSKG